MLTPDEIDELNAARVRELAIENARLREALNADDVVGTMEPQPIETAPRDGTAILAYGSYGWESLEQHSDTGWLVVRWEPQLMWDDNGNPVGGWKSITSNPYKDYMIATQWVPLPSPRIA